MENILNKLEIPYEIGVGEAAFYGPKLDIQIKNVFGKEDTIITVQVDFELAHKFDMTYIDKNGEKRILIYGINFKICGDQFTAVNSKP